MFIANEKVTLLNYKKPKETTKKQEEKTASARATNSDKHAIRMTCNPFKMSQLIKVRCALGECPGFLPWINHFLVCIAYLRAGRLNDKAVWHAERNL